MTGASTAAYDLAMRANPPRVSIIINCFNGARFLAEAVDSVLRQTCSDWELILWDDQSTDDSAAIFQGYHNERFRYFLSATHTPLGVARHRAVQKTRGEWIAFLDQDDIWNDDKLERQLALIDEDGNDDLALVYGRVIQFSPDGRKEEHHRVFECRDLPEGDVFHALLRYGDFIPMSSSMVRRSSYFAVGEIPPEYEVVIDYDLFLSIAERFRVRALQEPCCWYRVHEGNMMARFRMQGYEESLAIIRQRSYALDPRELRWLCRKYHSLMGAERIRSSGELWAGLLEILREGSLGYVLTRPVVRAGRYFRRRWIHPSRYRIPR